MRNSLVQSIHSEYNATSFYFSRDSDSLQQIAEHRRRRTNSEATMGSVGSCSTIPPVSKDSHRCWQLSHKFYYSYKYSSDWSGKGEVNQNLLFSACFATDFPHVVAVFKKYIAVFCLCIHTDYLNAICCWCLFCRKLSVRKCGGSSPNSRRRHRGDVCRRERLTWSLNQEGRTKITSSPAWRLPPSGDNV